MLDFERAQQRLAEHGQQHVLGWFGSLSGPQQARLLAQIEHLDLAWLEQALTSRPAAIDSRTITPCREVIYPGDPQRAAAQAAGEQALREGRVGVLLVAGGEGTRLGFNGPKGAFPIGAVSGQTLFQRHVEQLLAVWRRYGQLPALYLMTSEATDEPTRNLFAEHHSFGLPAERLLIFPQGLAPAIDERGKLLMDARDHLIMAPNGNGGAFAALHTHAAFEHMRARGIDVLSYVHVDNPLALSCDPLFIGYHLLRHSDFSCKSIDKLEPREKVGSFALVAGKLRIVEYNELPEELALETAASGELLYRHSNPGLFVWSRRFAEAQAARRDLPVHKAHKKIPHLDAHGHLLQPTSPCGYKLESFAMDTLPDAERSLLLWCERDAEFAPVKNATGCDSPSTARALMTKLYGRWIVEAGGQVLNPSAQIEISPLYALDQAELKHVLPPGFVVREDIFLGPA